MFSLQQIHAAHAKVRSGADFPAYVQALIQLGVLRYTHFVADGHILYSGKDHFSTASGAQYALLEIAPEGDQQALERILKIHQQGQTDYPTFCRQAAGAGVMHWVVDMEEMACRYFDRQNTLLVEEKIPVAPL